MTARSPKSWLRSFRYGVSPHPPQAPENSKSGGRSWASLTWLAFTACRSTSGRSRKNRQFRASCSLRSAIGIMLMALCRTSLLLLAGQTSTQSEQPVQSSGATWRVYRAFANSRQRAGAVLNVGGRVAEQCGRVHLGADHRVGAHEHALAALDAQGLVPYRDLERNAALLPPGRSGGIRAVHRQRTDREEVSFTGDHARRHALDELRRLGGHGRPHVLRAGHPVRNRDLGEMRESGIHRVPVPLHHDLAPVPVGLLDGVLDRGDGLVPRQHAADGEEARLHHGVDTAAHLPLPRDAIGVHHEEPEPLGDDRRLHRAGQLRPDPVGAVGTVEQEDGARLRGPEHIQVLAGRRTGDMPRTWPG